MELHETHTDLLVYMLRYQEARGVPPTMREMQDAIADFHYRSSVRYALKILVEAELVEVVKPPRFSRRYVAVSEREQLTSNT